MKKPSRPKELQIERVQTGVRMEKRLVKVLKAVAEYHDLCLGELLEVIALHAIDGKQPFFEETRKRISKIKEIYGMDYDTHAYERFHEKKNE